MNIRKIIALILLMLLLVGCTNGPIRYKTLGYYKYATVEITKESPPALKPVAVVGGMVIDIPVIVFDTAANIIWGVPLTFTHGGPDANGVPMDSPACLTAPFWYPATVFAPAVWPKEVFLEVYGEETGIFKDSKSEHAEDEMSTNHAIPTDGNAVALHSRR